MIRNYTKHIQSDSRGSSRLTQTFLPEATVFLLKVTNSKKRKRTVGNISPFLTLNNPSYA